ncbi:MAG: polyphosphate kinase 1 [Treponema sp.]
MKYLNRELAWIDFNERVLHEACNTEVPLLERLKFIGIVSSNFDEFFMVRVAGLEELMKDSTQGHEDETAAIQGLLSAIADKTRKLFDIQEHVLNTDILPHLNEHGLVYKKPVECTQTQQAFLKAYFSQQVQPLLKPKLLSTSAQLVNTVVSIQLHAAFLLQHKQMHEKTDLALLPIPQDMPRFVFLPDTLLEQQGKISFVLIDELICFFSQELFSDFMVCAHSIFKINRSANIIVDDFSDDDTYIAALQEILSRRRHSFVVRITCTDQYPNLIRQIVQLFALDETKVYLSQAPIGLASFAKIADVKGFRHLKNVKWKHTLPSFFSRSSPLWDSIKVKDRLLFVPYQSYEPVIAFVAHAAVDPAVISIQMTLYRTSKGSPIVNSLIRAAQNGKQVTVFVELKARFDEERNIGWVKRLRKHGVRVVCDLPQLKVHAKILLIMRTEANTIQGYAHLSTGNYNEKTAKGYADISLFTARPSIIADVSAIFMRLCGHVQCVQNLRHLVIAPDELKTVLLRCIERERCAALNHKPARIIAKMNSLSHPLLIDALYQASQAGVRIDLNVRGICLLIPQKTGLSENIRVVSVIDRYLEHSRVFYFENAGNPEWYLSSADWMPRNLERRIELFFPILDTENQALLRYCLQLYFTDTAKASEMQSDGRWIHCANKQSQFPAIRAQEELYRFFHASGSGM